MHLKNQKLEMKLKEMEILKKENVEIK